MGESDLTVYEKVIAEINKYLKDYGIKPIQRNEYNNPKLKKTIGGYRNGNNYKTAMLALSVLLRDEDAKKLSIKALGIRG